MTIKSATPLLDRIRCPMNLGEQLSGEQELYYLQSTLPKLEEENRRLREALRVLANEAEQLYFFAINNGIAEAANPPHKIARAALEAK